MHFDFDDNVSKLHAHDLQFVSFVGTLLVLWINLGIRIFFNVVLAKFWMESQYINKTGGNKASHPCRRQ